MRKLSARFAPLLLVLAFAACGEDTEPSAEPSTAAAQAEAAIRLAFANFANPNITQAQRDAAIEGGEQASAERAARWEQFKGQAASASFVIDEIRFVSPTEAQVDFHVRYGNGPSPVVPNVVHGAAVLQAGHWRVSKATTCMLASAMGNACLP